MRPAEGFNAHTEGEKPTYNVEQDSKSYFVGVAPILHSYIYNGDTALYGNGTLLLFVEGEDLLAVECITLLTHPAHAGNGADKAPAQIEQRQQANNKKRDYNYCAFGGRRMLHNARLHDDEIPSAGNLPQDGGGGSILRDILLGGTTLLAHQLPPHGNGCSGGVVHDAQYPGRDFPFLDTDCDNPAGGSALVS